jgi:hypothetical protein
MSTYLGFSGKQLQQKSFAGGTYRTKISIVDDTAGAYELQGPIAANTAITLPDSGTYEGAELFVILNGQTLTPGIHYDYVGTGTKTQVDFNFILEGTRANPDVIEFTKETN